MSKTLKCAIYTRKSTEDGLEQDFNSLDAQREAGLAYITSQRHEGWKALSTMYDDGGISGSTLKRPAITELLKDIEAGLVNIVVVYKVDRLTRSLNDFARLMELFDKHKVSFVSVTQQFNTTSSMGRLTLNVLLSFAQFEREVTGERIRDKIAASKKKGMWMGGLPPLGYDIRDKKLLINEKEAETIRTLFRLYLELGTVRRLKAEADHLGLTSKLRCYKGKTTGGTAFSRGHLYKLLGNPLYAGKIRHKDIIHDGQHEAIIEWHIWEKVQKQLAAGAAPRIASENQKQVNLLTGLAYDGSGDLFCPSYTTKAGRRYRYYVSKQLVHRRTQGWRIPAPALEQAVEDTVIRWLRDKVKIYDALNDPQDFERIQEKAAKFAEHIREATLPEKAELMQKLLEKVVLHDAELEVMLKGRALREILELSTSGNNAEHIHLSASHCIKRRGQERKIVLRGSENSTTDSSLIALVARSHRWLQEMNAGAVTNLSEIAAREEMDTGDVSRFLPLAFLAPEIVNAILEGRQPVDLTVEKLKRLGPLPLVWAEQKARLGFAQSR